MSLLMIVVLVAPPLLLINAKGHEKNEYLFMFHENLLKCTIAFGRGVFIFFKWETNVWSKQVLIKYNVMVTCLHYRNGCLVVWYVLDNLIVLSLTLPATKHHYSVGWFRQSIPFNSKIWCKFDGLLVLYFMFINKKKIK